jgi:hypothetical protein
LSSKAGIEQVLDQIASRTIQLEVLDRKAISEARRHKSLGSKVPFRNKMLEHRRLQGQITQLQRYRESALAHLDAVSNQEINQSFIMAIQNAGGGPKKKEALKAAEVAMEDLQESVTSANQISELLGQPIGEEVTDDDLELEFMDISSEETITTVPEQVVSLPEAPSRQPVKVHQELRVNEMFQRA